MSVDTHLTGKNIRPYKRVLIDDVRFLVAPSLMSWASSAHVVTKNRVLWRALRVEVNHKHQPS